MYFLISIIFQKDQKVFQSMIYSVQFIKKISLTNKVVYDRDLNKNQTKMIKNQTKFDKSRIKFELEFYYQGSLRTIRITFFQTFSRSKRLVFELLLFVSKLRLDKLSKYDVTYGCLNTMLPCFLAQLKLGKESIYAAVAQWNVKFLHIYAHRFTRMF